jgi:hypothetical protein
VVEPLLADLQDECQQARRFRRMAALGSGYAAFWRIFGGHALRSWGSELAQMRWRDALPFPGVLAIVVVCLSLSHAWIKTGSILNARFDQVDTRNLWLMVPVFVLQRWVPIESGIRALAIHAAAFGAFALLLERLVMLRPFTKGGAAFVVFCVVIILVQKKNSIVETPHGN